MYLNKLLTFWVLVDMIFTFSCKLILFSLFKERTNVMNTVSQFKRLIGKKFSDPDIQHELQSRIIPYDIVEQPDGKIGVKVSLNSRNESENEISF